jgi:hypothetical protein
MVGVLVSSGNISTGLAVAAVAIFRVATVVVRALLGAIVYACCWPGGAGEDADGEEDAEENREHDELSGGERGGRQQGPGGGSERSKRKKERA